MNGDVNSITIKGQRYTPEMEGEWNGFVAKARNATFLFNRRYMDYHSDRFADCSIVFRKNGSVRVLLPLNIDGDTAWSHQGLTYGGLIVDDKAVVADVMQMFSVACDMLRSEGVKRVIYKALPWIYHRLPTEEDLYVLTWQCGARLLSRDISSTIATGNNLRFSESRMSGVRKALAAGITIEESDDMAVFWTILENNLSQRYCTRPVHSLSEIQTLKSRFPDNIRLFVARMKQTVVGGTVIYEMGETIHTQYISASPEGKENGALDLLFHHIINNRYKHCRYFDFGKSTEQGGKYLNSSLIFQKQGFGGRGVCYDTYEWEL